MVQLIHRRVWFNGTTASVTGPDLDLPASFTIACRFKTDRKGNEYQPLISKEAGGSGNNLNYHLRIEPTGVLLGRFGTGAITFDVTGTTKVNDGAWHYGVLTYDMVAGSLILYLDAMRAAPPLATGGAAPFTNADSLVLGAWGGLNSNVWISDTFIYDRALSEAEIAWNYRHPNNPTRRGLQLSWTQDSIDQPAAGTWQDRSGNARNGALINTVTSKYPAIRAGANALFFPTAAGSDRVDCGNGASLDPTLTGMISLECWVKAKLFEDGVHYITLMDKYLGGAGWQLTYHPVVKYFYFYSTNGEAVTSPAPTLGITDRWIHIVVTHTGGAATGKFYINAIDKTAGSAVRALTNSALNLYVGNNGGFTNGLLGGFIAAARVYNRILSASEVLYNMQHPNNPIKRGCVLNLSPESLYGIRWYDLSGNANHGTITGAVAKNIGLLTGR